MSSTVKVLLLAALMALSASSVAVASNPPPFHFFNAENWVQACNDEQSGYVGACVTDPFGCAWGDEDDIADVGYGKLTARQTVTDTLCVVGDTCSDFACPHYIDWQVSGPANLIVTVTDSRGGSWTSAAVRQGNRYVYQLCIRDPYYTASNDPLDYPLLEPPFVPGSYGLLTFYTLSVTTPKTTNQVTAALETAQNSADGRFGYWHLLRDVPCDWSTP